MCGCKNCDNSIVVVEDGDDDYDYGDEGNDELDNTGKEEEAELD